MLVNGLEHMYHSNIGQAIAPALVSGIRYSIDGAVAGVAIGVLSAVVLGGAAFASGKGENYIIVFGSLPIALQAIKYGSLAGFAFGIGKSVLYG